MRFSYFDCAVPLCHVGVPRSDSLHQFIFSDILFVLITMKKVEIFFGFI